MEGNFRQITQNYGFNYMGNDLGPVANNTEIFLRQPNGNMLSLGTLAEARARVPPGGGRNVIGVDGNLLGNFNTPQIEDNLFIRHQPDATGPSMAPNAEGGRSRRSRRSRRSKRSRRSRRVRRSKRSRRSRKPRRSRKH
jgi:hypothetical protein